MSDTRKPNSSSQTLKLVLGVIAVAGLFIASRMLPVAHWLEQFNQWVGGLGLIGVLVFALVYVAATVLLLPGAILTVGAGFVFGLGWGFVAVSFGSTVGAALAFLIGRFLARAKIEELTRDKPKFRQIDRAIGERGARLILLLRLSPLIPFNLSNYFYGLTSVKFWPYVFASWLGMIPGTLLYVYLGTLGRAGLETAAGAETERSPLEWTLLAVGLVATVAVTVAVSRIARNVLREETPGAK
ncbi:MAG: hypothetical protein GC138_03250 [Gammaproteobacteria bacterium]|nr:hypothetical protein [Gammaproteobacteria bacterium]